MSELGTFWSLALTIAVITIIVIWTITPFYIIRACQRYKQEFLYRLRIRRAEEASRRGGHLQ